MISYISCAYCGKTKTISEDEMRNSCNNLIDYDGSIHPELEDFIDNCKITHMYDYRDCYVLTVQRVADSCLARKRIIKFNYKDILTYVFKRYKTYLFCSKICMGGKLASYMENLIAKQLIRVPPLTKEEAKEYIMPLSSEKPMYKFSNWIKIFPECDENTYTNEKAKEIYNEYIEHYYGSEKYSANYTMKPTFLSYEPFIAYLRDKCQKSKHTFNDDCKDYNKVYPNLTWKTNNHMVQMIIHYKDYINVKNFQDIINIREKGRNNFEIMRFLMYILGYDSTASPEYNIQKLKLDIDDIHSKFVNSSKKRYPTYFKTKE